jgi:hypothetical protein
MVRGDVFDEATLQMVKDFLERNTSTPKIALVRARPCDFGSKLSVNQVYWASWQALNAPPRS